MYNFLFGRRLDIYSLISFGMIRAENENRRLIIEGLTVIKKFVFVLATLTKASDFVNKKSEL